MAVLLDLYSGKSTVALTPDGLRALTAASGGSRPVEAPRRRATPLGQRLSRARIEELIGRHREGESVRALAAEVGVAASALVRLLRSEGLIIEKRKVSNALVQQLTVEYDAGATMRELEQKHGLSHGVVFRALHRARHEGVVSS
ncbi:hypothetical protein GCM10027058_29310 [Microbacterium neimengense]